MKTKEILSTEIGAFVKEYVIPEWDESLINPNEKGICSCCEVKWTFSTDWIQIKETGLCDWCQLYKCGKLRYVIKHRSPTFKEIKNMKGLDSVHRLLIKMIETK